jgi:hypothetical protein
MKELVSTAVAHIADLDEQIQALQEARDEITYPLEQAALRYHTENPSRGSRSCSRCSFVFEITRDNKETVVFTTDCSWCGKGFEGLKVSAAELAKYLTDKGI